MWHASQKLTLLCIGASGWQQMEGIFLHLPKSKLVLELRTEKGEATHQVRLGECIQ